MPRIDWNATVEDMRGALPATQFRNWIQPLTLVRADDRAVVLGVPSRFHEEWLRRHYTSHLVHSLRKQTGSDLQLEFEILKEAPSERAETSSAPAREPSTPAAEPARPFLRVLPKPDAEPPPTEAPTRIIGLEAPRPVEEPAPRIEDAQLPVFQNRYFEAPFNAVAYQCAALFTEGPYATVNPLVVVAGVGMGKTHLLAETGRWMARKHPDLQVRYTNAEAFTNEQGHHYRQNSILDFKRRFGERTHCLLFDDIHQLAGRYKTQELLLHLFNEITNRGGRLAFTTTVSPQRLTDFIEPLRSRLCAGVLAEVRPPNMDERYALLQRLAEEQHIPIDGPALRCLADQGQRDVRELLGSMLRLHLQARIQQRTVDMALVRRDTALVESRREKVSLEEIVSHVEHHCRVSREDMISKSRKGAVAWARQLAMYLARNHTLLSLEEIGRFFGRDHATVIHAFQKVKETLASNPSRRYEVEFLTKKLEALA
jgi:chromosomal replication initiator protein